LIKKKRVKEKWGGSSNQECFNSFKMIKRSGGGEGKKGEGKKKS